MNTMKIGRAVLRDSAAPAPSAPSLDGNEVKIVAAIPGHTVLVLEDGSVLLCQAVPGKVRIELGKKDQQGRQAYTVETSIALGNVTPLPPK